MEHPALSLWKRLLAWQPVRYTNKMTVKNDNLVKTEWEQILKGLLSVPLRERTSVHARAVSFVEKILEGTNELALQVGPGGTHYAALCELCRQPIHLADDYVSHGISGTYSHYDCHYRVGIQGSGAIEDAS